MEKEFVPYELALRMKQLGFDKPCFGIYLMKEFRYSSPPMPLEDTTEGIELLAPTFSQAFRWFREKGYDVKVIKESPGLYFGFYWNGAAWIMVGNGTYEEAELACLDKLIELAEQIERVEHGVYR